MRVTCLRLANMRRFAEVELAPGPGLNLITGDNGAGKTTLLEALHLMAYGRSFRGRVRDGLVRQGASALDVFVEWEEGAAAAAGASATRITGSDAGGGSAGPSPPRRFAPHRCRLERSPGWRGRGASR